VLKAESPERSRRAERRLLCQGEVEHALVEDLSDQRHDGLREDAYDEDGCSHDEVDHVGA